MKILITGGAGYIGSMLLGAFLSEGHSVTVYDNCMYNQTSLFGYCSMKNFNFIKGDVRDWDKLKEAVTQADVIIPLAAIVGAPACRRNQEETEAINLTAIIKINNGRSKEQRLIFPSTDSVYGIAGEEICTEETAPCPCSLYAGLKVEAEERLLSRGHCIIFRQATVFGASFRMRTDLMVNDFVNQAVDRGYIVLYESYVRRNFIYILNLTSVYDHALRNYDSMVGEIYNVGNDECNSTKLEVAQKVKGEFPDFEIIVRDKLDSDPDRRNYFASNAKLKKTGYTANVGLEIGIKNLRTFYEMLPRSLYKNA